MSSGGTLVSSRGDARISVAEKWANRRKSQKTVQRRTFDDDSNNTTVSGGNTRSPLSSEHGTFSIPPLCVLLRRSWNQTINGLIQHQQNSNADKNQTTPKQQTTASNSLSTLASTKHDNNKRIPFPSVLSVLKKNAVKLQVETIMLAEQNQNNDAGTTSDVGDEYGNSNGSGLSVLPANYDFTTSAVNHMSDSRSRAFLLLDFSAIVQTHTVWRKRLAIPKKCRDVQIVYSARHNCNPRLLQLLQRLGVGLRVATKYDLAAVREATGGNDEESAAMWDDASILVKPNSFYRNLLLNHNRENERDSNLAIANRIIPITVGNAEEMERIHKQLHIICRRRRQPQSTIPKLEFVVKLESGTDDSKEWKTVVRRVHDTASKLPLAEVVGVALELTGKDETDGDKSILLLDALSDLIENWVDEVVLSKSPTANPITAEIQPPQVHLTNPITATEIESEVMEWIEKHRKLCNGITIDASRLLMANAAALCARIIGVKNNASNNAKRDDIYYSSTRRIESSKSGNSNSKAIGDDPDDDGNGEGIQQHKREANTIQQHLYIDDGCYGSLSNYPNEGIPLPLRSQRLVKSLSATNMQLLQREQHVLVNTTVWGPTCEYIKSNKSRV
jgi:hypothetical protein